MCIRDSGKYVFIDTAGIRRKSRVDERVEKFSVMRAQMAICLLYTSRCV